MGSILLGPYITHVGMKWVLQSELYVDWFMCGTSGFEMGTAMRVPCSLVNMGPYRFEMGLQSGFYVDWFIWCLCGFETGIAMWALCASAHIGPMWV